MQRLIALVVLNSFSHFTMEAVEFWNSAEKDEQRQLTEVGKGIKARRVIKSEKKSPPGNQRKQRGSVFGTLFGGPPSPSSSGLEGGAMNVAGKEGSSERKAKGNFTDYFSKGFTQYQQPLPPLPQQKGESGGEKGECAKGAEKGDGFFSSPRKKGRGKGADETAKIEIEVEMEGSSMVRHTPREKLSSSSNSFDVPSSSSSSSSSSPSSPAKTTKHKRNKSMFSAPTRLLGIEGSIFGTPQGSTSQKNRGPSEELDL